MSLRKKTKTKKKKSGWCFWGVNFQRSACSHIQLGSAKQKAAKDGQKGSTRHLLSALKNQTLALLSRLSLRLRLPPLENHSPAYYASQTLPGLLGNTLFPRERVAPQVHLPAWDAVHHLHSPWARFIGSYQPHKLYVGFRPPESWPAGDRAGVVDAVRCADGGHGFRQRVGLWSAVFNGEFMEYFIGWKNKIKYWESLLLGWLGMDRSGWCEIYSEEEGL